MLKAAAFVGLMLVSLSAADRQIRVANNLGYTIYVGTLGNTFKPAPNNGGFQLNTGQVVTMNVADDWAGRVWGRTGCQFNSAGNGPCATGDCGNKLKCQGAGGVPPVTLAEFTFNGYGGQDFYDVSVVDGYNVPLEIIPINGQTDNSPYRCQVASCLGDINGACPGQYQVVSDGRVVGCKSACLATGQERECCAGGYASPDRCQGTSTSGLFKKYCPKAYSYAFDDKTSTFTCANVVYEVRFTY